MKRLVAACFLYVLVAPTILFSSESVGGERLLAGEVVFLSVKDGKGEVRAGVGVLLRESGNRATTNSDGQFFIRLPEGYRPGETYTLRVDAPGWQVWRPAGGVFRVPADTTKELVELRLLRQGSKAFLGPDQIERVVTDALASAGERLDESGARVDIERQFELWADRNGFTVDEVREAAERWARADRALSEDEMRLGLAAAAREDFDLAAEHFKRSAEEASKGLQEAKASQERAEEHLRALELEIAESLVMRADSYFGADDLVRATSAYQSAIEHIDHEKYPRMWASAQHNLGVTLSDRSARLLGDDGVALLNQAGEAFRRALSERTCERDPRGWYMTKVNEASTLYHRAVLHGYPQRTVFLAMAEVIYTELIAFESAKREFPELWALAQNNLGAVLLKSAEGRSTTDTSVVLDRAVHHLELALEIRTSLGLTEYRLSTMSNIAAALLQSSRSGAADQRQQDLARSISMARVGVEQFGGTPAPTAKATLYSILGNALVDQSRDLPKGLSKNRMLADAEAALLEALRFFTLENWPSNWGNLRLDLSELKMERASIAVGVERSSLIHEAVGLAQSSLIVHTRQGSRDYWARSHAVLGALLYERAKSVDPAHVEDLRASIRHFELALEVYVPNRAFEKWARTTNSLAVSRIRLSRVSESSSNGPALSQAIVSLENIVSFSGFRDLPVSLKVPVLNSLGEAVVLKAGRSEDQGSAVDSFLLGIAHHQEAYSLLPREKESPLAVPSLRRLGHAYFELSQRLDGDESLPYLEEAILALRSALATLAMESQAATTDRADSNRLLGLALYSRAKASTGEEQIESLKDAEGAFREGLAALTPSEEPELWGRIQSGLGIAMKTRAGLLDGLYAEEVLREAIRHYDLALESRDRVKYPELWENTQLNLGNAYLALAEIDSASKESDTLYSAAAEKYRSVLSFSHSSSTDDPGRATVLRSAHMGLGAALEAVGRFEQAAYNYEKASEGQAPDASLSRRLAIIYHDGLFDYEAAVQVLRRWLKESPRDFLAHLLMTEALFTTEQFDRCESSSAKLASAALEAEDQSTYVVQSVYQLAASLVKGDWPASVGLADRLLAYLDTLPEDEAVATWTFDGTLEYLEESGLPLSERLGNLFEAVQGKSAEQVASELRALRNEATRLRQQSD